MLQTLEDIKLSQESNSCNDITLRLIRGLVAYSLRTITIVELPDKQKKLRESYT